MKKAAIHIGTSGWHYKHWKGRFYPPATADSEQFNYFVHYFDTVEINNSFYKLPEKNTFVNWGKTSPPKFLFAVKASRFFTHMKKLNVDKQSIRRFFRHADGLGSKLGPVLFQLPPRWKINTDRLNTFLTALPKGYQYTFEFRDTTWYHEEVYSILRAHNVAFCIYELAHQLSPMEVTADFVYVRLHGPGNKYQGDYKIATLKKWATQCREWMQEKKSVFVYFDNDQDAFAAFNALQLKKFVSSAKSS